MKMRYQSATECCVLFTMVLYKSIHCNQIPEDANILHIAHTPTVDFMQALNAQCETGQKKKLETLYHRMKQQKF